MIVNLTLVIRPCGFVIFYQQMKPTFKYTSMLLVYFNVFGMTKVNKLLGNLNANEKYHWLAHDVITFENLKLKSCTSFSPAHQA